MDGSSAHTYSPSEHRQKHRSSSIPYGDQYRPTPASPPAARMPPPSPTVRERSGATYYDPTRNAIHESASAYMPKSPLTARRAFDPVHQAQAETATYQNGRGLDHRATLGTPNVQTSPIMSNHVSPFTQAGKTSPVKAFDPVRNGIHSHSNSVEFATPPSAPPQRSSNPMAMTNLLSDSSVTETAPVTAPTPPAQKSTSSGTDPIAVRSSPSHSSKPRAQPQSRSRDSLQVPKPSKTSRKRTSTKSEKQPRIKGENPETPKTAGSGVATTANSKTDAARSRTPADSKAPLQSGPPNLTERETEAAFAEIEARELSDIEADFPHADRVRNDWMQRSMKRALELESAEHTRRKRRRVHIVEKYFEAFTAIVDAERAAYLEQHEQEVAEEVRLKEIEEDKERKKDQQRKRRREKAIADEQIKKDEALQQLATMEDEGERARLQKEIQRYDKKIRDTKNRLQGIQPVKEPRNESPHVSNAKREREVAVDGGLMTSFYSHNGQPGEEGTPDAAAGTKGGRSGRSGRGVRARKSKEQKQAEKDNAARGQAFLDQGQDLPALAPKEEERLQGIADRNAKDDSDIASEDEVSVVDDQQAVPSLTGMARFESKGYNQIYDQINKDIGKAVAKVIRIKNSSLDTKQSNARKTAQLAAKEARRWQMRTNKSTKDVAARAKRAMREMLGFWKRNERDEREGRKVAEKQELERARRAEAEREANRQKRKLNFLISQTELYSHFIGKKVKTDEIEKHGTDSAGVTTSEQTLRANPHATLQIDLPESVANLNAKVTDFDQLDFDAEDETALQQAAMANAQHAIKEAQDRARAFDRQAQEGNKDLTGAQSDFDEGEMNFQNPTSLQSMDVTQPKLLSCQLKEYQLKGLNWLVNLYEQGINGILADEMGLGKTVQSISVMAYLAEVHNIWGPFLVIAPASTLHNWQQEIAKFVPDIKTLPYWGSAKDRKILRKYWDRKHITYSRESAFHVLVTSYQLVVLDAPYFQKVKWQYMILDEAQAIKSSQSSRWKSLLGFHCRNRLLLTGTPIQNNMQELWALLHFIMPSLFDSHDEFSEWFSKDIENHAQSNTKLNEDQLRRLHMILKPFMLRRIKKHVQKELGDKIEKDVYCDLTYRQRAYYTNLRNKISILDLIEKAAVGDDQDTATLMNLVMQFRKVCNHPDLFERAEVWSPLSMSSFAETASFMREGANVDVAYSVRSLIEFWLPNMLGGEEGRLDLTGPGNAHAAWRRRALSVDLNIWDERNIRSSEGRQGAFSWLRFVDHSATDLATIASQTVVERIVDLARARRSGEDKLGRMKVVYDNDDEERNAGFTPVHAMLQIADRNNLSPLASCTKDGVLEKLLNVSQHGLRDQGYGVLEASYLPTVTAPPVELVCNNWRTMEEQADAFYNVNLRSALNPISIAMEVALIEKNLSPAKYPITNLLPEAEAHKQRYTNIEVPSMRRFVTDSGKLACLDRLLRELKEGGHRVLLYFQMTRMIDLMEEYLTYRNYKYCRLDGSTKLEDRRDTVAAFQSSPEIFVFLLSTRAGGLGINLTSADTVIFYDSDWNPTIDSQAMDRAHRLGQTRQVTVYRLITRGTIEERIRKRALQKEEVQRVVISGQAGGDRIVDFNQRSHRENNRTKEMAMWLADDDQAAAIERREAELVEEEARNGSKGKKRRALPTGKRKELSMDDMYHEGEGNFADASHDPSGAATPIAMGDMPVVKKKKGLSKKAKTVKQRLAVVDGEVE